jgi:hypothetical protein
VNQSFHCYLKPLPLLSEPAAWLTGTGIRGLKSLKHTHFIVVTMFPFRSSRIKAATDYIAEQNRIFYMKWTTYMRESPEDERVSCVLYFVNPHSIKPVDLEIMAAIGKVAPLVPVIAKVSHVMQSPCIS